MDDLTDLKDENDHLALTCDSETVLNFNTGDAGPGKSERSFCVAYYKVAATYRDILFVVCMSVHVLENIHRFMRDNWSVTCGEISDHWLVIHESRLGGTAAEI